MFQLDLLDNWQEVLERDRVMVVGSSVQRYFLISQATDEERVTGMVAMLDDAGRLPWKEEEVGYRIKSQRYNAPLPGSSVWSVQLSGPSEYDKGSLVYHLYLSGGKDFGHLIYRPQELVRKLYYRVHERFGHSVSYFPRGIMDEFFEEKRKVVAGGLAVLEQAVRDNS